MVRLPPAATATDPPFPCTSLVRSLAGFREAEVEQTFHAYLEPDGRRRLAAKQLDKPIVTTAAADGALRTQSGGNPFENRQIVIVQPTHQTRIHPVRYVCIVKALAHSEIGRAHV